MDSLKTPQQSSIESYDYWLQRVEAGSLPDFLARFGICKSIHDFLNNTLAPGGSKHSQIEEFIEQHMRNRDTLVLASKDSNAKLYTLPIDFFELCYGDYIKNGCCYWPELEWHEVNPDPSTSIYRDVITGTSGMVREFEKGRSIRQLLTQAEVNMIRVSLARAEVREKQVVLDLGCGWGSAVFYILETYTKVKVVAVAATVAQRDFIRKKAQERKVTDRMFVIACDPTQFDSHTYGKQVRDFMGKAKFDRIYSIGLFEHVRNWEKLLTNLYEEWLDEDGKIFLDFFANNSTPYTFDGSTWLGRNFYEGAFMPAHDIIKRLDRVIGKTLEIEAEYKINGRHCSKTYEACLRLFDRDKLRILNIMEQIYGRDQSRNWYNKWRLFFLMGSELYGIREGTEFFVSHYLLRTKSAGDKERKEIAEKEKKEAAEKEKEEADAIKTS